MTVNQKQVNMVLAEFFGTTVLALVVYTILARTGFPFFTGMVAGVTVGLLTMVLGAFSNVHLNPAVTFGLWSLRKVQTVEAIVKIAAQLLGGLAAWMLLKYFLDHSLTSLAGDKFDWRGFAAETLGGFLLGFWGGIGCLPKVQPSASWFDSWRFIVLGYFSSLSGL